MISRKPSTLIFLIRVAVASPFVRYVSIGHNENHTAPGSSEFWTKLVISIGLVLAGGVFAG